MSRDFYLELAHRGIRMPIGTDLVLHESVEPETMRRRGPALGSIIEQAFPGPAYSLLNMQPRERRS